MQIIKMSDYILDINNYVGFCKSINEVRAFAQDEAVPYQSDTNEFKADTRVERDDYSRHVWSRRFDPDKGSCDHECFQHSDNNLIKRMDVSDFRELERLSSNLIQLLKKARQGYTQEQGSNRQFHGHELSYRTESCCLSNIHEANKQLEKHHLEAIQSNTNDRVQNYLNCLPDGVTSTLQTPANVVSEERTSFHDSTAGISGEIATSICDKSSIGYPEERYKCRRWNQKHNKMEKLQPIVKNRKARFGGVFPKSIKGSSGAKNGSKQVGSVNHIKTLPAERDQVTLLQDKVANSERELRNIAQRLELLETRVPNNRRCENQRCDVYNAHCNGLVLGVPEKTVQEEILPDMLSTKSLRDAYDTLSTPYLDNSVSSLHNSNLDINIDNIVYHI